MPRNEALQIGQDCIKNDPEWNKKNSEAIHLEDLHAIVVPSS